MSSFKDIFSKYKHYDPSVEAPGNPDEWKDEFGKRMGITQAIKLLDGRSAYSILGLREGAPFDEVRNAYRQLCKRYHPDVCHDQNGREKYEDVQAAYEVIWSQQKD